MGNLDTKVGRDSLPIIQSMIPWTEKLYDMTEEQIIEYKNAYKEEYHKADQKREREVMDVMYIEYQYFQIRKTYEWVMDQYKLSGDKMAIRREILLQRLRGSNNSPIAPEDLEYLISNMKKSINDVLVLNKWRFLLYEHGAGSYMDRPRIFNEAIPYLVGIDPAGGGGGDNFAITVVNPYNLQIAAEFKSPYISGPAALRMIIELVTVYMPKAVLIPERNSMGIYLIQMILESDVRDNLYWSDNDSQIDDMAEESNGDSDLKELMTDYKKYGTFLSGKVRKAMFELFFQYIAECKDLMNTEYLVNDICKLIRTPTGKIEADKGEHDDCLMSYLHAIHIYHNGDNLERFGIHKIFNPLLNNTDLTGLNDNSLDRNTSFVNDIYRQKSFEEVVVEDAMRQESEIKELVNTFSFINDGLYSRHRNSNVNPYDDTISIESNFFDRLNNF